MDHKPQVEEVVLQVLQHIIGRQKAGRASPSSHLTYDLKICSDDLSMYFVPELERRLGVKVPTKEWNTVGTVHEACALLRRHLG